MEQVLRTVSALNDVGFTGTSDSLLTSRTSFSIHFGCQEITMYETLLRPQDVNQISPLPHVAEIGEKLKQSELRREEKRLKQIAGARMKRKREEYSDEQALDANDTTLKRAKTEEDGTAENDELGVSIVPEPLQEPMPSPAGTSAPPPAPPITKINVSKTIVEVRGHTSYLTFACLLPTIETTIEPRAEADVEP
jgi:tRNA (adenine57-N1/adenine58-N1)-methyltransferase catalytic subunit